MSAWILWLGDRDTQLLLALVARRKQWLDPVFRALTRLADPAVAITVAGGLALGAVPELAGPGVHAALTLMISHGVVELVKRAVARPRPQLPVGLESLAQPPDRFSFPSGHAAAALAIALPIALDLTPVAAPIALAPAVAVGVSRCYLGVHYPGDVLAGWMIAFCSTGVAGLILA